MRSTSQKSKFFITLLIILSEGIFFTYAENIGNNTCTTCGGPAIEVSNFIDLANQIIDALPNDSTTTIQGSQYHVYGPWQGGIYNGILGSQNPGSIIDNIVAGTLKNFDKQQSFIRATTELLGIYSIDVIKDGGLGFLVISQPWPIVRDYQSLLDIDTLIGDKLYEIGIAGGYGKRLPAEQLLQIKELIINNSGEGKLFMNNPIIDNALTSTQALALLTRINNRLKNSLVLGSTNGNESISLGYSQISTVNINKQFFVSMKQHYACVRIGTSGKSCGSNFKKFKENILHISSGFIEKGPKKSRAIIEKASNRLATRFLQITNQTSGDFYKDHIDDYTQRETEILSAQGLTKRTGSLGNILKGGLSLNIPREIKNNRSDIVGAWKNIKNISLSGSTYIKDLFTITKGKKNNQIDTQFISPQQSNITKNLQDIINEHNNITNNQASNTTSDTQEALLQTLFYIRLINTILHDNIKEDLARTCELQCSNLGGICR